VFSGGLRYRDQWRASVSAVLNRWVLLPELISKLGYLREIGCEDGRWIELAQNLVHWAGFDVSGFEPAGSGTGELHN
jgi:hypothetical protein